MATTRTASLAISSIQPVANTGGANVIRGRYAGPGLSLSGSALLLMAKIPVNAVRVQLIEQHELNGAATNVMNFGVRNGLTASTSLVASAMGGDYTAGIGHVGIPFSPTWDDASGERFKYVVGLHVSGSITASLHINYQITYDMGQ